MKLFLISFKSYAAAFNDFVLVQLIMLFLSGFSFAFCEGSRLWILKNSTFFLR